MPCDAARRSAFSPPARAPLPASSARSFGPYTGLTRDQRSYAPISGCLPRLCPRWSRPGALAPAWLIAGLWRRSAIVFVGPPLFRSWAILGQTFNRSLAAAFVENPSQSVLWLTRLWPWEAIPP